MSKPPIDLPATPPPTSQHAEDGRDFVHHLAAQEERVMRRLLALEARVAALEAPPATSPQEAAQAAVVHHSFGET